VLQHCYGNLLLDRQHEPADDKEQNAAGALQSLHLGQSKFIFVLRRCAMSRKKAAPPKTTPQDCEAPSPDGQWPATNPPPSEARWSDPTMWSPPVVPWSGDFYKPGPAAEEAKPAD
jgi:hypothetical protein